MAGPERVNILMNIINYEYAPTAAISVQAFATTANQIKKKNRQVFIETDAIPIEFKAKLLPSFVAKADQIFDDEICQQPAFKKADVFKKREFFRHLLMALFEAAARKINVRYSRNKNSFEGCKAHLQVVECAQTAGYCDDYRATKTNNNRYQSRLVVTAKLNGIRPVDPWNFSPCGRRNFVLLRDRTTKADMTFNPAEPTAERRQRVLGLHNEVNSCWRIHFRPLINIKHKKYSPAREQLRPIGYCVFSGDFQRGGRVYYGKFGHQNLRKEERLTIEFEQLPFHYEPCVELDYGSYHGLIAYHEAKMDYLNDVYLIHGPQTTPAARAMAKLVFNTALNAQNRSATLKSCKQELLDFEWVSQRKKKYKYGRKLAEAAENRQAFAACGLEFDEIYDLLLEKHQAISGVFSSDIGLIYQTIDSDVCIDIFEHFARLGVACLGVHDSFLVPARYEDELRRAMNFYYRQRLGFWPRIKKVCKE